MTIRRSTLFIAFTGIATLTLALLLLHAGYRQAVDSPVTARTAALVATLGLSDLCLFTEASYTRNQALADLHTPFQEYPLSLEHFPSGALVAPPTNLIDSHGSHP